ncbi:MAG: xylulokinase [Deltaproteobacteria bacterium]|nr:xylulokinase [Deltaproteobacteria bacterium]
MTFLGIDLGTSEIKALLIDDYGSIITSTGAPLSVSRPQPLYSEQKPEDWWQATLIAVDAIKKSHPQQLSQTRGIGLSGQMHGATLLDANDQPLRPAILWNDTRSFKECEDLVAKEPNTLNITGNLAMPGFTAPKLLWVAHNEPEIFAKVDSVLLPKDYLRLQLCGEKFSEMSDAAGTLWLDVAKRDWSDAMLAACGLSRKHMPKLVEGSESTGQLRTELVSRWKMQHPVIIAGGAGDNAASAIGIGAIAPGSGFVSLGTSGVVFVVNDRFLPNPKRAVHAFCHALPQRWHQMSVMLSAASCLRWVTLLLGAKNEAELLAEVEHLDIKAREQAPIFLPYLSGERTPHNDPSAQGVFWGLNHNTTRAELTYSVIEGVAFGLADGVAALRDAGTSIKKLALVGGGSRSAYWSQLIADLLGITLQTYTGSQTGAALGAARLAQLACGSNESVVCTTPPDDCTFVPNSSTDTFLTERYGRFVKLYQSVAPLWIH